MTVRGQLEDVVGLAPGEAQLAQLPAVDLQQLGGTREVAAAAVDQPLEDGVGRLYGDLLAEDLEDQAAEQVHLRQFGQPGVRVVVGTLVDQLGQDRVGGVQVREAVAGLLRAGPGRGRHHAVTAGARTCRHQSRKPVREAGGAPLGSAS